MNLHERQLPVQDDVLVAWSNDRLRDYDSVQRRLPVVEESITQLDAGAFTTRVAAVSARDLILYQVRPEVRSVGVTVLDPEYVAVVIPLSWEGEYMVNGHAASASSIYLPAAGGTFYIRGGPRNTLALTVPRSQLIDTVAALRGVNPDEIVLDDRPHELHPTGARSLHRSLMAMLDAYCGAGSQPAACGGAEEFAREAFGLVVDAYLYARTGQTRRRHGGERLAPIVRRAEERFLDAPAEHVSLADLCAAAGVGKSTLYHAFGQICGVPPLEYLRRRRLMRARSILMAASAPDRGGVKRAALSVGLTELGRFSVEYRRLFGESPSTTLSVRR